MATNFFKKLRDTSEIKLRILNKFLVPWCAKLGSIRQRLWYVDGFAGPGRYEDGAEGSPLIGAKMAADIQARGRAYSLNCINVELNRKYYKQLCKETADFPQVENRQGDFSDLVAEIRETIQDDPALVFIDPFGISPLKFAKLLPLIERSGKTDLILTFHAPKVDRLAKEYPDYITDAIGSEEWRIWWDSLPPNERINKLIEILSENLKTVGRFLSVTNYPIKEKTGATPKYYLLFASRHYHAFELLNDFVIQEEITLSQKDYLIFVQNQLPLFDLGELDRQNIHVRLLDDIRTYGKQNPSITREKIVEYFVMNKWGQYRTGDIKRAVRALIDAGAIYREQQGGGHIDTDPLTFIEGN